MQLSESTIKTIKRFFTVGLACYMIFQLVKTAINTLPDDVLFFVTSDAIENFLCITIAYILFHYVIKLNSVWKKVVYILTFITILILLASLKDFRIYNTISFQHTFNYFTSFLGQSLLFYLLFYSVNQLDTLNKYQKLEKELHQAKEQLLRNQLHPHFLFNAFNSLYSLALQNHPETAKYILKLSSMMRYITDETHPEKVSLSKEIDFINKYIDIEKIRFGKNTNIQLVINGNLKQQFIEPFLLVTLVENAFKHGFYTNAKNAYVAINLNLTNDKLIFNVRNNVLEKQHFQKTNRKGKGLENLKKRLRLLYGNNASLETERLENEFVSELKIY